MVRFTQTEREIFISNYFLCGKLGTGDLRIKAFFHGLQYASNAQYYHIGHKI